MFWRKIRHRASKQKRNKPEPVLTIYKDKKWGYYAAEPDFISWRESPVARLSDESVQRMLDRIETASFSFDVEEIIRMDVSADDIR